MKGPARERRASSLDGSACATFGAPELSKRGSAANSRPEAERFTAVGILMVIGWKKPMNTERTRKQMMRAAKEMRDFYQTLDLSEETTHRAVKAALEDLPKQVTNPPSKPGGSDT
jgi:hypothetical protein